MRLEALFQSTDLRLKMAELKTKETEQNVEEFLNSIENEKKRKDSFKILEIMKEITGKEPKIWNGMVGFGKYHYKYDSGHEGVAFRGGFAPRKQNLVIYVMEGFEKNTAIMENLGKYKTGKCCLYINKLEDVNIDALKKLIRKSFDYMDEKYPS